ncbi:hypothetical protein F5876DRAFT_63804 [Lentinula aff. lateritia]|uniref:Uncharacterized protein n=1 Tax=Lentinula aff. lateritia TaxID=2804960 RepID=A0ACC1U6C6_9AGAR|nr:hypothetical protein F5876DRAFT_63804 [Lentinula aff. lateritia]
MLLRARKRDIPSRVLKCARWLGTTEREERTTNERIIPRTQEMQRVDRDRYRIRALNKAIKEVGYFGREMRDEGDVEELRGVGAEMKRELKGVVRGVGREEGLGEQGEKRRAEDQARMRSVQELLGVPGLGLTTAKELVRLGVTSVEQLQHYLELDATAQPHPLHPLSAHLTKTQVTNLRYLGHILQPATRSEIGRVHGVLTGLLPAQYEVECVGAYRRGFPIAQRIDVCLFHPLFHASVRDVPTPGVGLRPREARAEAGDYLSQVSLKTPILRKYTSARSRPDRRGRVEMAFRTAGVVPSGVRSRSMFLNQVVPALKAGGLVPVGYGEGEIGGGEMSVGQWKWSGVVRVPKEKESLRARLLALRGSDSSNVFRRLDLSIAPVPSKATALLFLTGDVEFVRDMRMRADRMGMVLTEFGLWTWDEHSWSLVPTPTEHSLFAALGMEYIPPEKRNYSFLLSRWSKVTGKSRRGGEEGAGVGVVLKS